MSWTRSLVLATLVAAACVGTNPRWDGPVGETAARDSEATSEGSTDASSDATSAGSGSASSSGTSASDASSSESSGPPMMCPMDRWPCDGECKQIDKDAHFCSFMCVDCVEWLGDGAKCEHGLCVPKDGGPGPGAVDEN